MIKMFILVSSFWLPEGGGGIHSLELISVELSLRSLSVANDPGTLVPWNFRFLLLTLCGLTSMDSTK